MSPTRRAKARFAAGDRIILKRDRRINKRTVLVKGTEFTVLDVIVCERTGAVTYRIKPEIFGSIEVPESSITGTT